MINGLIDIVKDTQVNKMIEDIIDGDNNNYDDEEYDEYGE